MPPVTIDAITTLLAKPFRSLVVTATEGRPGVLVNLWYDTSAAAIEDRRNVQAALDGAGYQDFDDPTDVTAGPGRYSLEFEVRS